jgi:hypothetical protein
MALALLTTTGFERKLKRVGRQDLDKLENIVNLPSVPATSGPLLRRIGSVCRNFAVSLI